MSSPTTDSDHWIVYLLKRCEWLIWAGLGYAPFMLRIWQKDLKTWHDFLLTGCVSIVGLAGAIIAKRLLK